MPSSARTMFGCENIISKIICVNIYAKDMNDPITCQFHISLKIWKKKNKQFRDARRKNNVDTQTTDDPYMYILDRHGSRKKSAMATDFWKSLGCYRCVNFSFKLKCQT